MDIHNCIFGYVRIFALSQALLLSDQKCTCTLEKFLNGQRSKLSVVTKMEAKLQSEFHAVCLKYWGQNCTQIHYIFTVFQATSISSIFNILLTPLCVPWEKQKENYQLLAYEYSKMQRLAVRFLIKKTQHKTQINSNKETLQDIKGHSNLLF